MTLPFCSQLSVPTLSPLFTVFSFTHPYIHMMTLAYLCPPRQACGTPHTFHSHFKSLHHCFPSLVSIPSHLHSLYLAIPFGVDVDDIVTTMVVAAVHQDGVKDVVSQRLLLLLQEVIQAQPLRELKPFGTQHSHVSSSAFLISSLTSSNWAREDENTDYCQHTILIKKKETCSSRESASKEQC